MIDRLVSWRRTLAEAVGVERYSYLAINELDRKLKKHLGFRGGVFVEAGANDGLAQSNTYYFERILGWRGVLVEGVPALAAACRRNRPGSQVFNTALVADGSTTQITIRTANLMSLVPGALGSPEADDAHLQRGVAIQGGPSRVKIEELTVPARTLTSVLDEARVERVDLLSLDVEGYELEVLKGLDLSRYLPRFVLVEARSVEAVDALLLPRYERIEQMSHHDWLYTVS